MRPLRNISIHGILCPLFASALIHLVLFSSCIVSLLACQHNNLTPMQSHRAIHRAPIRSQHLTGGDERMCGGGGGLALGLALGSWLFWPGCTLKRSRYCFYYLFLLFVLWVLCGLAPETTYLPSCSCCCCCRRCCHCRCYDVSACRWGFFTGVKGSVRVVSCAVTHAICLPLLHDMLHNDHTRDMPTWSRTALST